MTTTRASLSLAFESHRSFEMLGKARRRVIQDAATRSITHAVDVKLRFAWGAIPVDVDSNGDLSEAEVRSAIRIALARTTEKGSSYVLSLVGDAHARVQRIGRSWPGGRIRREHVYPIVRALKRRGMPPKPARPWIIDLPGEDVYVVACLSWETAI